MYLNVSEILLGFSTALDAVEGALLGATTYHAQRVAYISLLMAKKLGLSDSDRVNLAVAAALHDNALTEFIQISNTAKEKGVSVDIESHLGTHCEMGENNIHSLPIYVNIKDAVLYHHERADGSGPFGKKPEEIPIFARIIHIADRVDVHLDFSNMDADKFEAVRQHVKEFSGTYYDEAIAELFLISVTYEQLKNIEGNLVVSALYEEIPAVERNYSASDLIQIASMFARIIDFKSPFTTRHSMGIAEKARIMGEYYGWDEETCIKLYFAGAVHDVGKLFVDNDLLEKPGKLTPDEFRHIQDHAAATYAVLNSIRHIDDITSWASLHHEKLDGSGYPFHKTADELGQKERLMACLDVYQALVEPRPYKDGMSHEKTMSILHNMVETGKLDGDIVNDIDKRFKDWVEPKT